MTAMQGRAGIRAIRYPQLSLFDIPILHEDPLGVGGLPLGLDSGDASGR